MDVWVHGPVLVALVVIAICAALLVVLLWALVLQVVAIRRVVAPMPERRTAASIAAGIQKGPALPKESGAGSA